MFNSVIELRNGKKIGNGFQPFIIAEMACAHDGNFEKAKALIDASVEAGADATQLQFFVPEYTVTPHHEAFGILQDIKFTKEEWQELFQYARSQNILVFVCTYDVPSVQWAIEFGADGIKLNSADLANPEVIIEVAKSGIPFTLGTGASTLEEISNGLRLAIEHGAKDIILMHGVQNFPTKTENLNISRVNLLKDVFEGLPVGYADHTEGADEFSNVVDLVAVGMGVSVLEKHLTLDRSEKGIDYQAALEPAEYIDYVNSIHRAYLAYGSKEIRPFTVSDLKYRKFQKKSIVAAKAIAEGEKIDRDSLIFLRNAIPGIPPIQIDEILGKKASRKIKEFENVLDVDLY